jgi:hypothetical protein
MARIRTGGTAGVKSPAADGQTVWRVAVYIRLSKEVKKEDADTGSESVINQRKILTEYLEKSFNGSYRIADFYVDDGLSGTDDTRADFMRMISDIERGNVNCVICKTLSRAFRNYSDQGYYLEYYFPQKNVRFISTGDPAVDTYANPDAVTGLEVPITGLMNDRYAARTSSDVRRTLDTKRRNGEFIGAFPAYGYLKHPENKNKLIPDNDIVPVKREIYGWIVRDGVSLNGAARKLNELGVPNPAAYKRKKGMKYKNPHANDTDGLWTGATVKRVLLDKVNLGHMVQGKQRVVSYKVHDRVSVAKEDWYVKENTHEPTFTREEYETLEKLLRRDTRTPNGERKLHLFSGFLRCGDCGRALQRKSTKAYVYYACRTYTQKSKARCTKHSIREDLLEASVLAAIRAQISLFDLPDTLKNPAADSRLNDYGNLLRDKQKELGKLHNLSDNLYVDWKMGEITYEDYRRMKDRFDEQAAQLSGVIASIEAERQRIGASGGDTALADFLARRNIGKLNRALLALLVDTVYIHEDNRITVHFRFSSSHLNVLTPLFKYTW